MRRLLLLVSALLAAGLPAPQAGAAGFDGTVRATVVRVIDGDTFEAQARIWVNQTVSIHVRILGIDAPELHARCDSERVRAEAARAFLARRIEGADVELSDVRDDKYGGRVDAHVRDSAGDVAVAMLKAGLVRPYHGERRGSWCPGY
ncbi:MAG: thermonuclease family protein [Rhizomicrobium sp.]